MPLLHFSEALSRFSHLDARFVGCACDLANGVATYSVQLYPWWEHPKFVEAIQRKEPWGFDESIEEGAKVLTVHAEGVREFKVSRRSEVVDWDFKEVHPLLWPYENSAHITCNSRLSLETCFDIMEAASASLGPTQDHDVWEYVNRGNVRRYGESPPFSLGSFPRPLFLTLREQLRQRGIEFSSTAEPVPRQLPVLFLIDDEDYIVATDFHIDVPEFVHEDRWFRVRAELPSSPDGEEGPDGVH